MKKDNVSTPRHYGIKVFYALMVLVLSFGLIAPSGASAQGSKFTATGLTPESTINVPKGTYVTPQGMASVIVKLQGDSLASYKGDVSGLPATSPVVTGEEHLNVRSRASQDYLRHLDQKHQDFRRAAAQISGAQVTRDFEVVMNSVSMIVPVDKVSDLYKLPGVQAVYPDSLVQLETDNSPQFIGAPVAWKALGGQESAGDNVIVGVIDTGIWPEHPSFSDPDPSGKPYSAPAPTASGDPRACDFGIGANPGSAFTCNNKLIGAQRFMATYEAVIGLLPGEFTSARDDDGHGTHTASTSAGNAGVAASIFGVSRGTISGIAPRAHVMAYKVCGADGCFGSDSAAAIEQAIKDGVNVINFSISGGSSPYSDAVELAFLDAYNAGIFVAASAGNSGPTPDTTDHRGPWVTTVAASTQNRAFQDTVTLTADGGASLTITGTSLTQGVGPAPVAIKASDVRCDAPFTAADDVAGKIVICQRGNTGRVQKGYNVLQGGAVGMLLYNQSTAVTDLETDNHFLPAAHMQYVDGQALLAFVSANTNVQATLTQGNKVSATGDIMASFSSRGGTGQTLGVSKPDITAPGVQILAGASPAHVDVASGPNGEMFQAIAGTSMSSPHIAGAGALIKALHPKWTAGQIKSALMTTAWTSVVKEDGVTPATTFDDGSGRVDLSKAGDPGLTFDVTAADYVAHANDLWNTNYPSVFIPVMPGIESVKRTAHSTLPYETSWSLSVKYSGKADFSVSVPRELNVRGGKDASFTIVIDAKNVPVGEVRSATVYLTERGRRNGRVLHLPVTFIRKQPSVTMTNTCDPASILLRTATTCTITMTNATFNPANVNFFDMLPVNLKLDPKSVTGATAGWNTLSFKGSLYAAQPPDVSMSVADSALTPAGGYLPLSAFGIAPISGMGDETISNFNVPAFTYGGETYTKIGVVSDGYVVVGGGTGADVQYLNQNLPDAAVPNNVIAPYWTDLNAATGAVRVGVLTDGVNSWIIVDFAAVPEYGSTTALNTFEVWIQTGTTQGITYSYDVVNTGAGGLLTVGAENKFGNRGANYYYNGTGTLPSAANELSVNSVAGAPGETKTITFKATGVFPGKWVNYAQLTSDLYQGINMVSFAGEVKFK